jgi:hypothetical protein
MDYSSKIVGKLLGYVGIQRGDFNCLELRYNISNNFNEN